MDELQRITARLRDLERSKPTEKRRAEVEALLSNKWEGVQVAAAHVLGTWGGRQSVTALRQWLDQLYSRPVSWDARIEAARSLAKCVDETDVTWALDQYFNLKSDSLQYDLRPLIDRLPRRLRPEAKSDDQARSVAATRLLNRLALLDDYEP